MTANTYEIVRGKYSEYRKEIDNLIEKHWDELGLPGASKIKIDINTKLYDEMEEVGRHFGMVLKFNKQVIGYLSVFIYNHQHHQSTLFAQTDGFFIDSKFRGFKTFRMLCKMFKLVETILKEEFGVEYFYLGASSVNDLKFFAECMSFTPSAVLYLKKL